MEKLFGPQKKVFKMKDFPLKRDSIDIKRVRTPTTPRRKDSFGRIKHNEYKEKALNSNKKMNGSKVKEPNINHNECITLLGMADPYFIPLNKISEGDFFTVYLICRKNQRNIEQYMGNIRFKEIFQKMNLKRNRINKEDNFSGNKHTTISNINVKTQIQNTFSDIKKDRQNMNISNEDKKIFISNMNSNTQNPNRNIFNSDINTNMNDIVRKVLLRKEDYCSCSDEKYHSALKISKLPVKSFKEIKILEELKDCPYSLQIRNAWLYNELLYIETDYYNLGTLAELLDYIYIRNKKFLSEKFIRNIMINIIKALDVLESKKILHCDICPTNIFMRVKHKETNIKNNEGNIHTDKERSQKHEKIENSSKNNTTRKYPVQNNVTQKNNSVHNGSNRSFLIENNNLMQKTHLIYENLNQTSSLDKKNGFIQNNPNMNTNDNFKSDYHILLEEISDYLQYKNISYDNYSELQIVLGDFNISKYSTDKLEIEGTPRYLPLEALDGKYDHSSDLFSLSLIWLEMKEGIVLPAEGHLWHRLRKGPIVLTNMSEKEQGVMNAFLRGKKRPSRQAFFDALS